MNATDGDLLVTAWGVPGEHHWSGDVFVFKEGKWRYINGHRELRTLHSIEYLVRQYEDDEWVIM